jgi:hypothetical protein
LAHQPPEVRKAAGRWWPPGGARGQPLNKDIGEIHDPRYDGTKRYMSRSSTLIGFRSLNSPTASSA